MLFYSRNSYSNVFERKFSIPSNLISNKILFEIKFDGIENLEEETLLKTFYFFIILFEMVPSLRNFNSRYHLGKNFYNFGTFISFNTFSFCFFFCSFLNSALPEPDKVNFNSDIYRSNLKMNINDLKSFYLVESNPHFFKWDKDLYIYCLLYQKQLTCYKKYLDFYFWDLENLKLCNFANFWNNYVS